MSNNMIYKDLKGLECDKSNNHKTTKGAIMNRNSIFFSNENIKYYKIAGSSNIKEVK